MGDEIMLLYNMTPSHFECGYGGLGVNGELGHGDMYVSVKTRHHMSSISFQPPGKITYNLNGEYGYFTTMIGFNDTSFPGLKADFLVYADDVLVAAACGVSVEEQPRELSANLNNAKKLELIVETSTPHGCHPVWITPSLHEDGVDKISGVLGKAWGIVPGSLPSCEKCVFTTLTPSFVPMLDDMLGSLYINGECKDASVFIFVLNADEKCRRLASKYNATLIPITVGDTNTLVLKSLVYSIANFVNADYYLMLDADMLILKSIKSIFDTIKTSNEPNILVCREYTIPHNSTLRHLITHDIYPYHGAPYEDVFLQIGSEGESNFIVNGGLIAGSRKAWLSLDSAMRTYLPNSTIWDNQKIGVTWREQAIFNLALAKTQHYSELSPYLNVQLLHATPDIIEENDGMLVAFENRQPVSILHFNGAPGKEKYKHFSGKFSHFPNCKFGINDIGAFNNFAQNIFACAKTVKNKPHLRVDYFDIDELPSNIHTYKYIYDSVIEIENPKILEVSSRAGLMTKCLLSSAKHNNGFVTSLESNTSDDFYDIISPELKTSKEIHKHINGDILVTLKNIIDENNEMFDFIVCATHGNIKNIFSQITLASKLLSQDGLLYVVDSKYPICDIDSLNKRLNIVNYKLTPVHGDKLTNIRLLQKIT
jgi:hypothetical protein